MESHSSSIILESRNLSITAHGKSILRNVNITIRQNEVFGIIGPSGVGKSTLLKCFNRLLEIDKGFKIEGDVLFSGRSIYASAINEDELRTRIGILFQQPVIFPRTIIENVIFGIRHNRRFHRDEWLNIAERSLRETALWEEVKYRLHDSALRLSIGQQQRLCLARMLAMDPEILLMDEPTSALDAASTNAIEELILRLKTTRSIVLVTHDLAQARRVADSLVCICIRNGCGEIEGIGNCNDMLS
jgi:phosphate transport system ATP-binding protein